MGKITVKHYQNKKLKPEIINGITQYPVYIRITYGRENERIKSLWLYHSVSEFEFENNATIKNLKDYETELIKDILYNNIRNENVNIQYRLIHSLVPLSKCFIDYTLSLNEIQTQTLKYICDKSELSEGIIFKYVKLNDLHYSEWIELADKIIFEKETNERIKYLVILLKFESIFYPNTSERFEVGNILNFYEWKKSDVKQKFLKFAKDENLLPISVINVITEIFDTDIIVWRSIDMRE